MTYVKGDVQSASELANLAAPQKAVNQRKYIVA